MTRTCFQWKLSVSIGNYGFSVAIIGFQYQLWVLIGHYEFSLAFMDFYWILCFFNGNRGFQWQCYIPIISFFPSFIEISYTYIQVYHTPIL